MDVLIALLLAICAFFNSGREAATPSCIVQGVGLSQGANSMIYASVLNDGQVEEYLWDYDLLVPITTPPVLSEVLPALDSTHSFAQVAYTEKMTTIVHALADGEEVVVIFTDIQANVVETHKLSVCRV